LLGLTPRFITAELTMADVTPEMAAFKRWRPRASRRARRVQCWKRNSLG